MRSFVQNMRGPRLGDPVRVVSEAAQCSHACVEARDRTGGSLDDTKSISVVPRR